MLGTPSKTPYNKLSDFKTSADYLKYLYNKANGYAFRCILAPSVDNPRGVFRQCYFSLADSFESFDSNGENIYVSMNSFRRFFSDYSISRDFDHLKRINALYVDIDCYNAGLTQEQTIWLLHEEYIGSVIPEPTFIINSGRGVYVVWKLDNEDLKSVSRWKAVEKYLIDALRPLGADSACQDPARVLRVPFSINSKSKSMVEIVEFNDLVYRIHTIASEYGVSLSARKKRNTKKATINQRKAVAAIVKKYGVTPPDLDNFAETRSWLSAYEDEITSFKSRPMVSKFNSNPFSPPLSSYEGSSVVPTPTMAYTLGCWCNDLESLMAIRHGSEHHRENALFLYRLWNLEITSDPHIALNRTLAFNRSFSCPLPENLVIKATESAERKFLKGGTYSFKVATIIDFLCITDAELSGLASFSQAVLNADTGTLTTGVARDRKAVNRAYYCRSLEKKGEVLKEDKISARRTSITSLLSQGLSHAEIMEKLSISRATFYRDLSAITAVACKDSVTCAVSDSMVLTKEKALAIIESLRTKKMNFSLNLHDFLVSKFQSFTYRTNYVVVLYGLFIPRYLPRVRLVGYSFSDLPWDCDG